MRIRFLQKIRGLLFKIRCGFRKNVKIGQKFLIGKDVKIFMEPGCSIDFGDNVYLKDSTIILIQRGANLAIGSNTSTGHNTEINCSNKIEIGDDVLMAAYSYISDVQHGYRTDGLIRFQPMELGMVKIGDNVWLGRNCMVLKGADIGFGAVIGANVIVKKQIPKFSKVLPSKNIVVKI